MNRVAEENSLVGRYTVEEGGNKLILEITEDGVGLDIYGIGQLVRQLFLAAGYAEESVNEAIEPI